ncbi:MAG: tetratricopeptide repeat protein [Akkermansiaceae bacterium]|nr:tetratricopeptide repeat protein [Armatimonadota bacterium]
MINYWSSLDLPLPRSKESPGLMKRRFLPNNCSLLRGVCCGLIAIGALPDRTALAAVPLLPGAIHVSPAMLSVGADEDPNMDPDFLYLQALTQQSGRYRKADGSNFRTAIKLYDEALKRRKNFYDALYNKAICHYLLKDYKASIDESTKHIALRPEIMQAYVIRAQAYVKTQNLDPALADLNRVEQKRPDLMEYRLRGQIYYAREAYAQAVPDFERYVANNRDGQGRIKPAAIGAYLDLGDAYGKLNSEAKSVESYGAYIASYPDPSVPWEFRGDKEYDNLPYALDKRGSAYLESARKNADPDSPELTQAQADFGKYAELEPQSPTGFIGLGNVALLRREWDQAVQTLDKAVSLAPANDSALAALGEARRQQSLDRFNANPTAPGATPSPAVTASIAGLQKSVSEFGEALQKNPTNTLALRGRGLANSNPAIGNYTQAAEDFTRLLTLLPAGDPRIVEAYFNRASAYLNMNPPVYDKAIPDFTAAIASDPKNTDAYVGRGDAYAKLGQYNLAIRDYDVVINSATTSEAARLSARRNRGYSYTEVTPKRLDEAITDFTAYLQANPGDQRVKDALFSAELQQGPEKQLSALTKRIGENKNDAQSYLLRAAVYDSQKRYEEAIADYKMVSSLDPNNIKAYQNLAFDYSQKGLTDPANVDGAIAANSRLIALEPTNTTHLLARGDLYGLKKQYPEAAADYKKAISQLPEGDARRADVQYLVANLFLASGNRAAAKQEFDAYFNTAKSDHAKYLDALVLRGDLQRVNKSYAGAITDYSNYLAAKPGDVKVLKVRGQSYLDSGDEAKALADFETATTTAPDAESLTLVGSLYYSQAAKVANVDPDKALPLYKKATDYTGRAISSNASYAGAYYFKGLALAENAEIDNLTPGAQKSQRQDALTALNKFVELAPGSAQVSNAKSVITKLTKAIGG